MYLILRSGIMSCVHLIKCLISPSLLYSELMYVILQFFSQMHCPPSLPSLYSKDLLSPMNCTARNPLPSGFWLALPVDQKVGRKKEQGNSVHSHRFCATSLWLQLGNSSSLVLTFNGGSGDSFHPLALRY